MRFTVASSEPDFVALEAEELARWSARRVFERSVEQRRGAEPWRFFEGPPTANGRPGLHHVWVRVFKDLFCRYQAMRGREVVRRAGWDTHGLPVEVQVERELGLSGKRAIEAFGIARFNERCRATVLRHVGEWERLTRRIGFWVDLGHAYRTFDPGYVESVWWHLRQLFDAGLLYEDEKVVPYCPRCETALSSHELGQPEVYRPVVDEAVLVRLPLEDGSGALLVWTTTPWTLPANVAVAVDPRAGYALVDGLVLAERRVEAVLGAGASSRVARRLSGAELVGRHYRRPFDDLPVDGRGEPFRVVAADAVAADEGTGLVHLAPAFGEVDRDIARQEGLPAPNPVRGDGRFDGQIAWLAGLPAREASGEVVRRLEAHAGPGGLFRAEAHEHDYPHCWRCSTPLVYWAKPSWFIATSSRKGELLAANETVSWHPGWIKEGRFGEWLRTNVDWALSRDRYWGTPLPIWRCDAGHVRCVGSLAELSALAGQDLRGLDPHRPWIDEVGFPCPDCTGPARRVEAVADVWLDSGSMPAAQLGYPHAAGSAEQLALPADLVAEAIDQTRGWFYALLAVNRLALGATPYRHVLCLGHLVDDQGRKMSKSVGNVIEPFAVLDDRGADPLRWWMLVQGQPWSATRTSLAAIDAATRQTLLTFWNACSFFATYASLDDFEPGDPAIPPPASRAPLDRWLRSRLHSTVLEVTGLLDAYDPHPAARALALLVDDVSNWFIRRSRRRFWRAGPGADPADSLAAEATLHEALVTSATLLGPFVPFLADHLWRRLVRGGDGDSVHLADWPVADPAALDLALEDEMALVRRLASLGRAARGEAGVRVRQPLGKAVVVLPHGHPRLLAGLLAEELNVDVVEEAERPLAVVAYELVPNYAALGPRLGERARQVRPALGALDAGRVAETLLAGATVTVPLGSTAVELGPDEIGLRARPRPGFAVASQGGEVVALELALTDDLVRRGEVREVVRQLQEARRAAGLAVSDRIELRLSGLDRLADRFPEIAAEVLASRLEPGEADGDGILLRLDGDPARAWITPLR